MIKALAFDLDGVLANARNIHEIALNEALNEVGSQYVISHEEHLSTFDGLPTTKKLEILTERRGLPIDTYNLIWELKQEKTRSVIKQKIERSERLIDIFEKLTINHDLKIVCCSNSIRKNTILMLHHLGILQYFDYILSNEDVDHPKPHSEIYLQAMLLCQVNPKEMLILEDSHIGRTAAIQSGAHLCPVKHLNDVTYSLIIEHIDKINDGTHIRPKWQGGKMNVLIPMAGAGSRFEKAGYTFPKPLIDVENKPMIQQIVENLNIDAHHIYLVQKSHYEKYNLKQLLNLLTPGCDIVQVDGITEGAACTTLLAKWLINNNQPLLIANSDQILEWDSNQFMYSMIGDNVDGGIVTFTSTHPKWSFAKLSSDGYVSEVAEKNPISDIATVGVYFWAKGSDYVKYAEQMIKKDIRVNNEFYVCPVFNEAIQDNKKFKIYPIKTMHGIGTPEDLQLYLNRDK